MENDETKHALVSLGYNARLEREIIEIGEKDLRLETYSNAEAIAHRIHASNTTGIRVGAWDQISDSVTNALQPVLEALVEDGKMEVKLVEDDNGESNAVYRAVNGWAYGPGIC